MPPTPRLLRTSPECVGRTQTDQGPAPCLPGAHGTQRKALFLPAPRWKRVEDMPEAMATGSGWIRAFILGVFLSKGPRPVTPTVGSEGRSQSQFSL